MDVINLFSKKHTFYFFVFFVVVGIFSGSHTLYKETPMIDEVLYKNYSDNFNTDYLKNHPDTKSIYFLSIEYALGGNYVYTRILNFILILAVTGLIYNLTKSKMSFLYPLIPIFLTSMWLTAEIIEIFFILLSFKYINKSGFLIGLSSLFRLYSLFYVFLLSKKQKINCIIVVSIGFLIMAHLGILDSYMARLLNYGTNHLYDEIGYVELLFLAVLAYTGISRTKVMNGIELWKFELIAALPLFIKLYGHYFLPIYTLLLLGYLLDRKEEK